MIRVTVANMQLLVDAYEAMADVSDAAQEWLSAKESADDREFIRDLRDGLDAALEDAEGPIFDLCSLLGKRMNKEVPV